MSQTIASDPDDAPDPDGPAFDTPNLAEAVEALPRDRIDALVTSPGIPHLYPRPHPAIAQALRRGVPVDNDIGLFFRSFGAIDWAAFDTPPRVICVTGSNGKSTTTAPCRAPISATRALQAASRRPAGVPGTPCATA